jgi:hypothetical protein
MRARIDAVEAELKRQRRSLDDSQASASWRSWRKRGGSAGERTWMM